ncbi:MAG: hypothetical protein IT314_09875 [Anaerolineales bacterium]|nr:hypothetical protein [Anaerolineales bacterium]
MSRTFKVTLFVMVLLFSLACSLVTNPINDVKNTASTAQALATDVSQLTTAIPIETISALPTTIAGVANYFDPQGTPIAEWNGLPIMSQATAGQEFDSSNYSFKFTGTVKEAVDFYTAALSEAGWSPLVTVPGDEQFATLTYQKDGKFLTVTISNVDTVDQIVVWFMMA